MTQICLTAGRPAHCDVYREKYGDDIDGGHPETHSKFIANAFQMVCLSMSVMVTVKGLLAVVIAAMLVASSCLELDR
jgi:hypothetical protein